MKIFVVAMLLFFFSRQAIASTPDIKAMDFYPSGAVFTFSLPVEGREFRAELPGAFTFGSVRIINQQDIDSVKIITQPRREWIPPALEALKAQTEEQEKIIRQLMSRKSALEQTEDLLKAATPPSRTDAKDIISYIQMAQDMKLTTENELDEIKELLVKEKEKLDVLNEELSNRMPAEAESAIIITGKMNSDEPLIFEVFTPYARWSPQYTMDLDSKSGKITTRLFARASQTTGLEYDGKINFHTKRPEEYVTVPKVNALKVSIKPKPKYDENFVMMDAAAAPMAMAMKRPASQARKMAEPDMKATLTDHAVTGAGSLTGDGRMSEFALGELELTGKLQLVLIPEQRSSAWIIAEMDSVNDSLIPGEAVLRVDGTAAGTTAIPEYGLGQKQIAFGYAPQITSQKEPLIGKTGSSWFSGESMTGGYKLKISNSMNEAKKVIVKDRLPVPTDDKIKLDVKSIKPEPKERDKENRLTWELELQPKETIEIISDYSLSYPSGEELQYKR